MRRFSKSYADRVARFRVPMGFLLLALFGWLAAPTLRSIFWGAPVAALGLALRGWAAGHLEKNQRLITSGPYAWLRNPLYAGSFVAAMGLAMAAKRPLLAWLFFLFFYFVYLPAVELEEQHLRKLFPDFADYERRVRLFLPSMPETKQEVPFSWTLYFRNEEYKALLAFLLAVGFLFWKAVAT